MYNKEYSDSYREHDNIVVNSTIYSHYHEILFNLTNDCNDNKSILDIGCGTGRYFSAIRNFNSLIGIDTSEFMIHHAKSPINIEQVDDEKIFLYNLNLEGFISSKYSKKFDFIYSIGVYGEHVSFNFDTIHQLDIITKKGSKLFITFLKPSSIKKGKKYFFYFLSSFLPIKWKLFILKKIKYNFLFKKDIEKIFIVSNYRILSNEEYEYYDASWGGTHYDFLVEKI
jgi:SAM-dependent methyltransferase